MTLQELTLLASSWNIKNQQNIACLSLPNSLSDLKHIDHVWDKLCWCVWNGNQPYQNHCEFRKTQLQKWDRISCLGRMYGVNLMMKIVPSCYLTAWRLYTTYPEWAILWLFAPDPESVCSREKVLKKLQLSQPYCQSSAYSWPPCGFHWFF